MPENDFHSKAYLRIERFKKIFVTSNHELREIRIDLKRFLIS